MSDARYRWTLNDLATTTSYRLTKDPIGWEELSCKLSRDEFYKGVFIDFTMSLRFHCNGGGKQFIDNIYQTQDIQGIIELLIEYDCDQAGGYVELYTGRINLASYKTDQEYTTCNIERSSLFSKLKARDDISIDLEANLSVDGSAISTVDSFDLPTPSTNIIYYDEWRITDGYEYEQIHQFTSQGASGLGVIDCYFTHRMPLYKDDFDTSRTGIEYDEFMDDLAGGSLPFEGSFVQSIFDFDGTLNGVAVDVPLIIQWEGVFSGTYDLQQTASSAHYLRHKLQMQLIVGTKDNHTLIHNFVDIGFGVQDQDYIGIPFNSGVINNTFTMFPGESIWIVWHYRGDVGFGGGIFNSQAPTMRIAWHYDESYFKFTANTKYTGNIEGTTAKVFLIHEAFNQVSDSIADKNISFYSDFYGRTDSEKITYGSDGCGSLRAVTNGLSIRQFDRQIFCSLKDLYSSADAIDNIGLTIENDDTIRVEKESYFFDKNTQILNLDKPVKVETINDNGRYFNRVIIGYQKWETEFKGGLEEPNAKHEYANKINAVKGEYNKLSKYMASSYAIEFTRRKSILRFPTDDFRYDNDNFFIQVVRSTYVPFMPELYADSFTNGSGMDSLTTAYNLRLTPAHMLINHIGNINAALQIIHGKTEFVRGDGNTNLSTKLDDNGCQETYSGEQVAENMGFDWDDNNPLNYIPLWLPEKYTFSYPLTNSQLNALRANPHGYIQFIDDHGHTRKGFILNVEFTMKTGLTKFELLRVFE